MGDKVPSRFSKQEGILNQNQMHKDADENLQEREKHDLASGKHGDKLQSNPDKPEEDEPDRSKKQSG